MVVNKYADNYHSVRPGYPDLLFKDIQEQCRIDKNSRLLEIGAGSGIATTELVKMGGRVIAIEPGENLANILRKQTKSHKNVEVFEGSFESFKSADKFNTILAFTAFHWLGEDKYENIWLTGPVKFVFEGTINL